MPVPYIVDDPDELGGMSLLRLGEVLANHLCQVCGDKIENYAYAIVRSEPPGFEERIFNGLLHAACARLSFRWCPNLRAWKHMKMFEVRVSELPTGPDGAPTFPVSRQSDPIDVEAWLGSDPMPEEYS